jgi:hypothetical protein
MAQSAVYWQNNTKSFALPPRKTYSYLPPVKDTFILRTPGDCSIPYECGKVYIGQVVTYPNQNQRIY